MKNPQTSRRGFLRQTGLALASAVAFPAIIPARVLGRDGAVAPSNRVTVGIIGYGSQGVANTESCLGVPGFQVTAVCDVDEAAMRRGQQNVDRHYSTRGTQSFFDYRELIAKAHPDAVVLSVPDHWHALVAIAAARAGMHIYGEKPLAHTLREGRAICDAVERNGIVWQTGSWQRSGEIFRRAVELVRSGALGKVTHVEAGTFGGISYRNAQKTESPPPGFHYDLWLGPAPWRGYDARIVKWNWRWVLDFGGGNLLDWVGHHVDIAHWALGLDQTGPVRVSGTATYGTEAPWDVEMRYRYVCTYADGLVLTVGSDLPGGTKFYGEKGWLHVDRDKPLQVSHPALLRAIPPPNATPVYRSTHHFRNWFDCIKTGRRTVAPCEAAHRSASVGHLGHIAALTGRTLHWNPQTETLQDDPGASALLNPVYRSPWVL